VWNEQHGVSVCDLFPYGENSPDLEKESNEIDSSQAEGYTRQEITFSGSVNVRQIGHATLHLGRHNETYLIPLPNVKIKGILTGSPYPELQGTYHIPSTSNYASRIEFSSSGWFSGSDKKHSFHAAVYRDGAEDRPLYTITGNWDSTFIIKDTSRNVDIETFDVRTAKTTPLTTDSIEEQDPWESRVAWRGVREALERGDMQAAADAKSKLERGQREMRMNDDDGKHWNRLFYRAEQSDKIADELASKIHQTLDPSATVAVWKFRVKEWEAGQLKKPYRGDLKPDNTRVDRQVQPPNRSEDIDAVSASLNTPAVHESQRPSDGQEVSQHQLSSADFSESEPRDLTPQLAQPATVTPTTNSKQMTPEADHAPQNEAADNSQLASGVGDLTVTEKVQVEEYLRDKYASSDR
jgi:hypothetical protein